jgi:hypothetical protein
MSGWDYIFLAIGSGVIGIVILVIVLFVCLHFNIDITQNVWVLAIPVVLAVFLNILFIELYQKYKKK